MALLAHSPGDSGRPHLLLDHLRAVAASAAERAAKFGAAEIAWWCGLWHDLGKFHPDFQAYLHTPARHHGPDHSSAGAVLAAEIYSPLAFPIAGHHAGLPSLASLKARLAEREGDPTVKVALMLAETHVRPLRPSRPLSGGTPVFLEKSPASAQELFLRMIFSTLVDADYLDTERHFTPAQAEIRQRPADLHSLWNKLLSDQSRFSDVRVSDVNRIRHEVYEQCVRAADQPQGVFSLTVPTGGGKTRSAMAFALKHAMCYGLDRVIVAIPYTSIIEQTADVYRGIFGNALVLEHHSAVDPRAADDGAHPEWARLASENWDAPIIVSTTVQLFESLLADRPSRCRKLHNIARSVLILDEVQTLPPHLLAPILDVLKELVAHYGVTVALCTATQPAFTFTPFAPHLDGFSEVREIIDDPGRYFAALKRVCYERPSGPLSWPEVAARLHEEPQVLAVVNTKRDAMTLLDALDDPQALHLSTLLCGAHRRDALREVGRRLSTGERCCLISTQVVEAGVDLDFPTVFRAMAPLDRIVQAAGRCNREGRLGEGRVVVFEAMEGGMPKGAYRTGADIARGLLRTAEFDFHDPTWYEQYFRLLYQARDLDEHRIQVLRGGFDYPEVARRFRLIPDETVPVIVRYRGPGRNDPTIDALLKSVGVLDEIPRSVFRQLQPYLVQLWASEVAAYERAGLLTAIRPGLWEWQGGYDPVRGIIDGARDPDMLVV